jgi:hypothetical protein
MSTIPAGYFEDAYQNALAHHLRKLAGKPKRAFPSSATAWLNKIALLPDAWMSYEQIGHYMGTSTEAAQSWVKSHRGLFDWKWRLHKKRFRVVKVKR